MLHAVQYTALWRHGWPLLVLMPACISPVPLRSWEASGSGSWFAGLLARHEQLHRWLNSGRPKAFWMSGFFNPQGFLTAGARGMQRQVVPAAAKPASLLATWAILCVPAAAVLNPVTPARPGPPTAAAVKQEVARRNRWPLDAVVLSSDVTRFADESAVKSAPDEGVYVCGLFLDGAAWSGREQRLVDSEPKVGAAGTVVLSGHEKLALRHI